MICEICEHEINFSVCGVASVTDEDTEVWLCHADDHDCLLVYSTKQLAGSGWELHLPPEPAEATAVTEPSPERLAAAEQLQKQFPGLVVNFGPPVSTE